MEWVMRVLKATDKKIIVVSVSISVSILLLIFLGFFFFGRDIVSEIQTLKHENIKLIEMSPHEHSRVSPLLTDRLIAVLDDQLIEQICDRLRGMNRYRGYIDPLWNCVLTIHDSGEERIVVVRKLKNGETIFSLNSNGEWGRGLGSYRSDELGDLIESIVDGN